LLARLILSSLLLLSARSASAQTAELFVYFDLDREPASGCTVETAQGAVDGIELRLRAVVDTAANEVRAVQHAPCADALAGSFAPEVPVHGGPSVPWDAVAGDGTSGSTLIEAYLPLSAAPFATTVHAYVALDAPGGSDAILANGGAPIAIALRATAVPWGPPWLAALLALALLVLVRRALPPGGARALAFALALSPLAVHAGLGDGSLRGWTTLERVASDPEGDAPAAGDLVAAFAFVDPAAQVLYLRVDALLGPPICLAWPTVAPGSGYSCSQEPPPDPASGMRFALTFDDGPNLASTPSIVATLRAEGVPATFFVQGNRLNTAAARALTREVHEDALFRVANHSFTHPSFPSLTLAQMRAEIASTTDQLRFALDDACYFPRFFRFPFSATNCTTIGVAREYGLATVGVHLDTLDWCFGSGNGFCAPGTISGMPDPYRNDLTAYVLYRAQQTGGGIVLMHDIWGNTASHLPGIIAGLRALGATFVTLDDASAFPLINASVNVPEPPACCDGAID
jgi:peptidoglycan/xylan/chitin deacetylase (PgdA/CDA1 family)